MWQIDRRHTLDNIFLSKNGRVLMFRLIGVAARLAQQWHERSVIPRWPRHLPPTRFLLFLVMVFGALAILLNAQVRHAQLQTWTGLHGADGASLFSTADAPYFLHHAGLLNKGLGIDSYDGLRTFPNLTREETEPVAGSSLHSRPLLSVVIAHIASSADPAQLIASGNRAILLSAALTAVMIIICFGAAGYWMEGSVAAIGGGLSLAYLTRSSIGRIDTDQLNLGFMYLMFGLVVFAGRASSRFRCLIWCGIAGITAHLFMWWYGKPELIFMAAMALAWMLLCLQKNLVTAVTG